MKNCILLFTMFLSLFVLAQPLNADNNKRKKKANKIETSDSTKTSIKKLSKYERLFKGKNVVTAAGKFLTLHQVDGKLYIEMPLVYLGREMLLASTTTETSDNTVATNGYKVKEPLHVVFTLADSLVQMRKVNARVGYDATDPRLCDVVAQNFVYPVLEGYKVLAYTPDSSAILFDMTAMFTGGDAAVSPVVEEMFPMAYRAVIDKNLSSIDQIKAFDDNVSIRSSLSYSVSAKYLNTLLYENRPLTIKATRTILLLPEDKDRMRPRISDSRVGVFLTLKQYISNREDELQRYSLANRWRLEPSDIEAYARGELVEPRKPIVFYLDPLFPEAWKEPIRRGVTRWNKAFEKIGFTNVIQVLDFPTDDPAFDPDNLKYSCIRYVPSSVQNAMGPSWVDPVTGEILNATILVYNDVVKMLHNWRFVQTAQVDVSVRAKSLPRDVFEDALSYVVAHEMGHCLGLMHNMAASAAYPVDSLRSVAFTQKYGTTPSIMDYARFNYIAQPGDKGVRLTPPDLGVYDEYAIKWLYTYFPDCRDEWEEAPILESWVDEKAGDPRYRYGKQQMASRYDPSALEEDLGDNPMKAGDYGIRNLKYILSHLNEWITDDDDASCRQQLYTQIVNQYARYLQNVVYCIGGIYLTEAKDGTPERRFRSVPRERQKAAMAWLMRQLQDNDWLDNRDVCSKFKLHTKQSAVLNATISDLLTKIYMNVTLSSYLADNNPYTIAEFFDDYYRGAWDAAIKNRPLTSGDKILQKGMLGMLSRSVASIGGNKLSTTITFTAADAYTPSVDEICLYNLDPTGSVQRHADNLRAVEAREGKGYIATHLPVVNFGYGYDWQNWVRSTAIDESATYYYDMALKIKRLLERRLPTACLADKAHYQAMLYAINSILAD